MTGDYTPRQLDGIAGYFVLVHAELESYFEDKAIELIDHSLARWTTANKITKPLFSMMTYYEGERKGPPQSFDPEQFKDRKFESLVNSAAAHHRNRVAKNNGIKEKDLCEILFPVGFSYTDIDSALIASLDSFGQRRGSFAHQSIKKVISTVQIDPFVEAGTVQNIVDGISAVDAFFASLRT
jgi:hypothetical protein